MQSGNPTDILSLETRHFLALCARLTESETTQFEIVKEVLRHFPTDKVIIALFSGIDWTDRESISPLLKLFGLIRKHTRRTSLQLPRQLDEALAKDGFRFNQDWQLVKLNL